MSWPNEYEWKWIKIRALCITHELLCWDWRRRVDFADFRRMGCILSSWINDTVDMVSSSWLLLHRSNRSRVEWADSALDPPDGVTTGLTSCSMDTSMTLGDSSACMNWRINVSFSRILSGVFRNPKYYLKTC